MSPHFRVSNHKCISGISHMCHMPWPSHPFEICIQILTGKANNPCCSSLHLSLQTPRYFILLRSKYYPLYCSQTSSIYPLPLVRYHILLPYKTPGKVKFLCSLYFLNSKTTYTKICKQQLHTSLHLAINKAATLTQTLTQYMLVSV